METHHCQIMSREDFEREIAYTQALVAACTARPKVAYGEIEEGRVVSAYTKNSAGDERWR